MRVRLADGVCRRTGQALSLALMVSGSAAVGVASADAGSSTHAKTKPGVETASSQAEQDTSQASENTAPAQPDQPTERTAKADPASNGDAGSSADTPPDATQSPIGAGWEAETLVQPNTADDEITDTEALEIIERVDAYFNHLKKVKADFVQFDGNNKGKSGDFYFKRPGKVRFDYDRPSRMKIISNGEYLAVENHDLRTSDRYSLDSTPFKLLLSEQVDLLNDARILSIDKGEDVLILTMEDKSGESAGQIRLFFHTDPELKLASWIITDAQGVQTRVDISELQRDVELSAELFEFSDIGMPDFRR